MSLAQTRDTTGQPRPRLQAVVTDPLQAFLDRLERVRKSGRGYTAKCPAHEDRTASLSITAGDDGRILLHCFASCSAAEVVAATGLTLADLFVRRPTSEMTFAERAALREHARQSQWRAALNVFALEAKIVQIAAHDAVAGKPINADDCRRLCDACARIDAAREVLCGHTS